MKPLSAANYCDGIARRDFVRIGSLAGLGLALPNWLRATAAPPREAKAKSCILIWLDGGPSHIDTFDLKPDAPAEVRGPLATPIATTIPGYQLADTLPNTAQRMQKLTVIRSVTSPLGEHNFGTHYMMTGYKPSPVLEHPMFGAVLAHVRPSQSVLPANVAVPDFRVGGSRFSGNGFLPAPVQPFSLGSDPSKHAFAVRDLEFYPGLDGSRLARRRGFVAALDRFSRLVDHDTDVPADPHFEQAFRLVTSPDAKRAFDLNDEPPNLRQRYGSRSIGQSCLLARRLVERGVPFVTVNNVGWDTHQDLYTRLKEGYTGATVPVGLVPSLDLALSGLLDDLDDRGLLRQTLVVVMGEFGRTPKINTQGGRDHWPRVFSVALAGGGTPGGLVLGTSDSTAESPKDRPVTPDDLAATIYQLLGIDPSTPLETGDGRTVHASAGTPIREIVG